MEDNLKKIKNGRQPQIKNGRQPQIKNGRRPQKKNEDNLKIWRQPQKKINLDSS